MKKFYRIVSALLCLALFVPTLATTVFAAAPDVTRAAPGALEELASLSSYLHASASTEDNTSHLPVNIYTYYDKNKEYTPSTIGEGGSVSILYVMNTNTERLGKKSDAELIQSFLDRGFFVLVLDYQNNPEACGTALDWSVQDIRCQVIGGSPFKGGKGYTSGTYTDGKLAGTDPICAQSYILPAGYDIAYNIPYFSYDKYGVAGSFEYIVEIWNNDFRGTKGDRVLKWVRSDGSRKSTATAFDGTEPLWLNADGTENADGEYIKVKHTYAEDISDCARPDGSPIDLKLYMHIVYPTSPAKKVPVMCLASSSEHLCGCSATVDRPHLLGAAFRGYAAVMYDYGYTPMARVDHYEYFDGFPKPGYITGDNPTYSIQFYNDKRMNCAAMRFIRLLAMRDGLPFDVNAIGVYGNSKGGWMGFLGEEHPETMVSRRIFGGHHDETR